MAGKTGKPKSAGGEIVSPPQTTETGSDELAHLRGRLGITDPLRSTIINVKTSQLHVPHEATAERSAHQMETNLALVGMLHPPCVVPTGEDKATGLFRYDVLTGRRRVLGARANGVEEMQVRVYDSSVTPEQIAFIQLSENMRRSTGWVEELRAMKRIVDAKLPMTEKEVSRALGVNITVVRIRVAMARLPQPIVDVLLTGDVPEYVAKQLLRLTPERIKTLARELGDGKVELTSSAVKDILDAQINAGMKATPLVSALSSSTGKEITEPHPSHRPSDHAFQVAVEAFCRTYGHEPRATKAVMLAKALHHEMVKLAQQLGAVESESESGSSESQEPATV